MQTLFMTQMDDYSAYHRDHRNKLTHYLGIPAIVLAIIFYLKGFAFYVGDTRLDAALVAFLALGLFYLSMHRLIGIGMIFFLGVMYLATPHLSAMIAWVLFIGGWVLQFIGHYFEGRKPAFFRNGVHLLVGPMWILNDLLLKLGLPGYQPQTN